MYKGEKGKRAYEENIGKIKRKDLEEALEEFKKKVWQENPIELPHYQQGWVCNQCGGTNAPWVSRCPCVPLPAPVVTC